MTKQEYYDINGFFYDKENDAVSVAFEILAAYNESLNGKSLVANLLCWFFLRIPAGLIPVSFNFIYYELLRFFSLLIPSFEIKPFLVIRLFLIREKLASIRFTNYAMTWIIHPIIMPAVRKNQKP